MNRVGYVSICISSLEEDYTGVDRGQLTPNSGAVISVPFSSISKILCVFHLFSPMLVTATSLWDYQSIYCCKIFALKIQLWLVAVKSIICFNEIRGDEEKNYSFCCRYLCSEFFFVLNNRDNSDFDNLVSDIKRLTNPKLSSDWRQ